MSWQDRNYASDGGQGLGKPGGDWAGMRPSFDNPFTWAFSIARIGGITVRVHVLFIVFAIIMLLRAASSPGNDLRLPVFELTALWMGVLFVLVLAHEFGHCLACRWTGGEADEILMWPLGGLAYCRPDRRWTAHLITAVGGPAVNVVFCLIAGGMLGLLTGRWLGVAIPNPLAPWDGALLLPGNWAFYTLYFVNMSSMVLLLFNLMPIFPLDGGRILQSLLWPRFGYSRSMRFAVRAGYVGAILLGIYGAVKSDFMLVSIAIFGGITCYITQKQLQWTDETLGFESDEYALSLHAGQQEREAPMKPDRESRRAQKIAQREQQEAQEVDRILQKIAQTGIDSLTRSERNLLKRVTERKRHQE